jgi:hypothetical protein
MDYNDPEYLKLFKNVRETKEEENLNEVKNFSEYENLSKNNYEGYQRLTETPKHNYNVNENINDGWNNQFSTETRINGVPQKTNDPYQMPQRRVNRRPDPNGLNQFIDDDDMREVYRPQIQQTTPPPPQPVTAPIINEKFTEVEVVTLDMFENINKRAFIELAQTPAMNEIKNYR